MKLLLSRAKVLLVFVGIMVSLLSVPRAPEVDAATKPGYNGDLVYYSIEPGNYEVYRIAADGSRQVVVASSVGRDWYPQWSPDGSKIAFYSNRSGDEEIYVINSDGTGLINLTNTPGVDAVPQWSPDGSKIAFRSSRDGNNEVYVMNADGSNQTRLTNSPGDDQDPQWSPDGSKLAFRSDRDGNIEIYVMSANGDNQVNISNAVGNDQVPQWSPDGSKLVHQSTRDGNNEIYVMNADGSNQRNLTNDSNGDFNPQWSPDGSKIVFRSNRDGNDEVYVMNEDGSGLANLTNSVGGDFVPQWSPDGSKIAFRSDRDGNGEIYVMNSDGSDQANITNSAGNDYNPVWRSISNQPPVVVADQALTIADTPLRADVLVNDTDEQPLDPSRLSVQTQPSHGVASVESGKVNYVPHAGFVGSDQLTYRVCDSFVLDQKCSTGVLSITVRPAASIAKVGAIAVWDGVERVATLTTRPTFSGTATPYSIITIEIHSDPIVLTTTADEHGNWSVTPDLDLPPGDHTVYISARLHGVTTGLDSFVLAVQQTTPNTGGDWLLVRVVGILVVLVGSSLAYWQRRRVKDVGLAQVPKLFR